VEAYFGGAFGAGAEPVGRVALEEGAQQGLRLGAEELGHAQLGAQYLAHGLLAVLAGEGQRADEHFEHEDAQRPPVAHVRVALAAHHLGRHVLDGAAEAEGAVLVLEDGLLAQAKVGQGDVALVVQENA